jgi:hypothetical protein
MAIATAFDSNEEHSLRLKVICQIKAAAGSTPVRGGLGHPVAHNRGAALFAVAWKCSEILSSNIPASR